jgi:dolichol-phosphate mannosyltransferase
MTEATNQSGSGQPDAILFADVNRSSFKVIVVLPVFNEEPNIGPLLDRLSEHFGDSSLPYEVVAVDDASSDRSLAILEEYSARQPVRVLRHEVNQGLGASLRDGLYNAAKIAGERDIIVTMDADATHTPGLILRMVRMVREGHDVVIASRYQPGSVVRGVPLHRRVVSRLGSLLMRVMFPIPGVRDYTCGYRAYLGSALRAALARYGESFVDQDGFQCMVDILLKLRAMRLIFGEAPLILRYDLKQGASKMRLTRTAVQTLRVIARRRMGK